jgi:DnaJ-domain-containing protein 1
VSNKTILLPSSLEEEELGRKSAELEELEIKLLQGELDLVTLHAELKKFDREYQQTIVTRSMELERIEKQIAEYIAYLESNNTFTASEGIKKLYREIAKLIHPDLTTDSIEKIVRGNLMVEANQAYEDGNIEKLHSILNEWKNSPESIQGEDIGAKLIRAIRKVAQCRRRLHEIQKEIEKTKLTELYQLYFEVSIAKDNDMDLLAKMANNIEEQIFSAQQELKKIKDKIRDES